MGIISPILAEVSSATAAEDQEATDAALSKLWDALPDDEKRTKIFADLTGGQNFTSFTYTPPANEMARPEGVPPEAKQVRGKKSGRTYWAIPDGQGGWQEVELEGAG